MSTDAPVRRLVIASHNPGKIAEIRDLLDPLGYEVVSAGEAGAPEPEETGASFAQNALIKAEACMTASGLPALADDSGLAVEALGGAPGIYAARWAGPDKDFHAAMRRVEQGLEEAGAYTPESRRASFVCALCLAESGEDYHIFTGRVFGHLVWPPRGDRGFGYDPVFVPDGHDITFGEMAPEAKHRISHRALAFAKLVAHLRRAGRE
ncbi:MAG: RdgB/HAM1 family non-canonical purine NTP pyrophosphatase [Dichotomicrobium sp.]